MTPVAPELFTENIREYRVCHTFNRNFINCLNRLHRQYGDDVFEVLGIANRNLDIARFSEDFFNKSVGNVADVSVDDNSNVSDKNISHYESESTKALQKLNSLAIMYEWVEKIFSKKDADSALEKVLNGEVFISDLTSYQRPYCFAFDLRNMLFEGMSFFKGNFKIHPPKRTSSFVAQLIQSIAYISNQIVGACMHKDQKILVKKEGGSFFTSSKDLYEEINAKENSFTYSAQEWTTKSVSGLEIWENQKFVPLQKVYRRAYSSDIYTITTASGKCVKVSSDHIFKVLYRGREIEVKAKDLKKHDTLVNTALFKFEKDINCEDYRTGQMLGILCGDGCLTQRQGIEVSINAKQTFISDFLDQYFFDFYGKKGVLRPDSRGNCFSWELHSVEIKKKIIETYFESPQEIHSVDKCIRLSGKTTNFKMGFLDGIMVTDGSWDKIYRINLTNKKLIALIEEILSEFGIETNSFVTPEKGAWKEQINLGVPSKSKFIYSLMHLRYSQDPRYEKIDVEDKEYVSYSFLSQERVKKSFFYKKGFTSLRGNVKNVWRDSSLHLDVIIDMSVEANDHPFVYEVETSTGWYSCGGLLTHNCSFPDALVSWDYFLRKEHGEGYALKLETDPDLWFEVKEQFQNFIYSSNFPFRSAGQSAFVNLSIMDKGFLKSLFTKEGISKQDYTFPDGSVVDIDSSLVLSKKFFEYYTQINSTEGIFTFPVITLAISKDSEGRFMDPDFVDWVCKANSEKGLGNVFINKPTSFSSCCRLKNDFETLSGIGYSNSFGVGSLGVGSHRVSGLNLPRMAFLEKTNPDIFEENIEIVHKILYSHRKLLEEMIAVGAMPLYSSGWIHLQRQYSTVGFVGMYEYIKNKGLSLQEGENSSIGVCLLKKIEEKIISWQKEEKTSYNLEQIPAESFAVRLCKLDTLLGFNPHQYALYSNQYLPLWEEVSIYDRFRLQGIFDSLTSGGAILHINVQDSKPLSPIQFRALLEQARISGTTYFAINLAFSECGKHHFSIGQREVCPVCQAPIVNNYTRVVGYLSKVSAWNKVRRTQDYPNRYLYQNGKLAALAEEGSLIEEKEGLVA